MQVLVVFYVTEDHDILIVNRLTLVAVLVTRLHNKDDQFAALCILPHHVAGLVEVGTVLAAFQEGLTVVVI